GSLSSDHEALGNRGMGLVPRNSAKQLFVLALVAAVDLANPSSSHRIQRSHDYVSARDGLPDSRSACTNVLLRLGRARAASAGVSRRMVGHYRWRSLRQWTHLLWN